MVASAGTGKSVLGGMNVVSGAAVVSGTWVVSAALIVSAEETVLSVSVAEGCTIGLDTGNWVVAGGSG